MKERHTKLLGTPADTQSPVRGPSRQGPLWRRALGLLASQRVGLIWMTVVVMLATFAVFRAALLIASREDLGSVGAADILRCFLVGMRYDAVPIAYVMIPFVLTLTLAPNLAFPRRWFRRIIAAYAAVVCTLALIVEVIGMYFFRQFGVRLNWIALDYLGGFQEAAAYIQHEYPVWILPVTAVVGLVGLYLLFRWVFGRGSLPRGPIWPRPIVATLLIGSCVLAARGSLGHQPLRFGPAYFCENRAVAQLTLNNFFTLQRAAVGLVRDIRLEDSHYTLPSVDRAKTIVTDILAQKGDEFLYPDRLPFWRRVKSGRPRQDYNVVIIIMEGMGGSRVGAMGNSPSQTPVLDDLCRKGLFFERMYGVAGRTSRALIGILCGHPDLSGRSLMKRSRAQQGFLTLPGVLRDRGYRTVFVYGGDPDFDNMKGFFAAGGIERFVGQDQMTGPGPKSDWGFHDEVTMRKAHETFLSMRDQKFFGVILTVSYHEPFDVPAGRVELLPTDNVFNKMTNACRYADWSLGEFFRLAQSAPYFKKTIFVLIPDNRHGRHSGFSLDVAGYRIPCLIYAPGIIPPGRIKTVASQTDVAPTVLAVLGGEYQHGFLGRNMLAAKPGEGFAMIREYDRLGAARGQRAIVLMPGEKAALFKTDGPTFERIPPEEVDPREMETLKLQLLSYHTVATHLYLTNSYQAPKKASARGRPESPEGD